jgi:[protein-PII] uridylyltransferase
VPSVAETGPEPEDGDRPKLSAGWERLRADHDLRGREWSRAAVQLTDAWLRETFDRAMGPPSAPGRQAGARRGGPFGARRARRESSSAAGPVTGVALVAVGSLGRGDLAPGSDLDLLLVHDGRSDITQVADRLWYPVWDDPMPLDHSVRTLAQVGPAAESDLRVAQGLLDARPVAGDIELGAKVVALGRRLWEKRTGVWLPAVLDARERSREAHGDVAFLLEPELQEGWGGLRDVQLLALLATVTPVVTAVVASAGLGPAGDVLHAVRVELQRDSGRRSERLMLEDQDRIAASMGLDSRESLALAVAGAGRTISWLSEDAGRRARSWLAGPRGRAGSADRILGPGLVLRDGEVVVPGTAPLSEDPTLALRAATASAELGVPLSRATMARLAQEAPVPRGPWPEDVTRAFVRLLSVGPAGVHAIETLDQLGVWERYLPEWPHVRNRPQFNPYHRWSVDRHLLETVANAAAHVLDVRRPDLLVLGALLHDIGKGTGADHSEAGAEISAGTAARLGLSGADGRVLQRVVRYHLLLPEVATRRDLEDPATVTAVVEAVGDETTLELLGALTAADGEATGPAAWTPWKARLVEELVQRADAVLGGRPVPTGPSFPSPEHRRLMEAGGLQVLPHQRQLVVVSADRPGLFSDVTGALALHDIGVLEARAHSEAGHALQVFTLDLPEHAAPRWDRVVNDITASVEMRLNIAEALARRPPDRRSRRLKALPAPGVRVIVDNDAATNATVVEVRAPDAPGMLHRITAAIAALGLDIVSARVATLGHAVVDSFYVRSGGSKLSGPEAVGHVRAALEKALGEPPAL